jgi:hypothetical protein
MLLTRVENGGNGIKLGLYHVQAARIAFFDTPYGVGKKDQGCKLTSACIFMNEAACFLPSGSDVAVASKK